MVFGERERERASAWLSVSRRFGDDGNGKKAVEKGRQERRTVDDWHVARWLLLLLPQTSKTGRQTDRQTG